VLTDGHPSKRLGQHWLTDARVIRRLVDAVVCEPDALCLEIGPGRGALTLPLAQRVPRLIAVELDARWVASVRTQCSALPQVTIVHDDILTYQPPAAQPLVVVGAIPYQLTSAILERLIAWKAHLRRAYLVVQREVAQRLAATPGTPSWGRLSCLAQYQCLIVPGAVIPRSAFRPPPRVESQLVTLTPRTRPPCRVVDERLFFALIARLFQTRRKTIAHSLKRWDQLSGSTAAIPPLLHRVGIAPQARGETLSLAQLATLANALVHVDVPRNG